MIVHSSMAKKLDPLYLSVTEQGIGGMPVWLKVRDTLPHICVGIPSCALDHHWHRDGGTEE